VLLTPVLASAPLAIGVLDPMRNYAELSTMLAHYVAYTPIENASGACAIALPLGFSRGGLPIGLQFTARPGAERTLLELAYALERTTDWHHRRPPLWAGAA